jgi:hypothetical protein
MTQRARKGKLYQLQVLIDLSCFIISHILVLGCPHLFSSTKLIYFANTSHKGHPRWNSQICQADILPHTRTTSALLRSIILAQQLQYFIKIA